MSLHIPIFLEQYPHPNIKLTKKAHLSLIFKQIISQLPIVAIAEMDLELSDRVIFEMN
jgi:hypothetical protein